MNGKHTVLTPILCETLKSGRPCVPVDELPLLSVRESFEHIAGPDDGELSEYITDVKIEILGGEGVEEIVGTAKVYDIAGLYYDADVREEDATHSLFLLDAESGELEELHYALMDWYKTTDDEFVRNILHIQDIKITANDHPEGLLTVFLEHMLDYWSLQRDSATMVTFWAIPTRKDMDVETWRQTDPAGYPEAQLELIQLYERHGFRLAPDSDFMVCHLTYQRDRMPGLKAVP